MQTQSLELGIRLEKLLKHLRITQLAFAQSVGVSAGFINKLIKGKKDISGKVIINMTKNYPEVNVEWLVYGTGDMIKAKRFDMVNEPTPIYGAGILESLIQQMKEMDARLKALEQSQTKS